MRLQITTDYAIRIMLYMLQQGDKMSTAELTAKELGITHSYFNKVAHKLRTAGFLASVQGPNGGYYVAKNAEKITLYDIVSVMEGEICINRCLDKDGFCSRNATQFCPVHRAFENIQNQIISSLKSVKIRDLCDKNELSPSSIATKYKPKNYLKVVSHI